MKKNYLVSLLVALVVSVLGITACSDKSGGNANTTQAANAEGEDQQKTFSIAYVNIDTLLLQYNYSKDLQEQFMRKAEANQATINQQGKKLEDEMRDFQYKIENNAFFNQERARSEQERLMKKQQEFQALSQKLSNEMMAQQNEMNKLLSDTIMSRVNEWNKEIGKYTVILSNAGNDNILYADDALDITKQVVDYLNSKYTSTPKETDK